MNIQDLLNNPEANPVPEEIKPFLAALLDGKVKQFVLIAQVEPSYIMDGMYVLNHEDSDYYQMVGAIECAKRDYMRMHISSRVEYQEEEE